MQKISPFSVATAECNKAVSGCVFWLVRLGLDYSLEEVGPWVKPRLGEIWFHIWSVPRAVSPLCPTLVALKKELGGCQQLGSAASF